MKYKRWNPRNIFIKTKKINKEKYKTELEAMAKDIYEYLCQASVRPKNKAFTESRQTLDKVGTM